MKLLVALVTPLFLLASCSAPSAEPSPTATPAATRAWLKDFNAQYGYDTSYMERLLDLSPAAYDSFAMAMPMAEHRVKLPIDAHFVGCISALMADDCGACTQLNLKMAVEAGVDRTTLRQLLDDPTRLPDSLRLVHAYAKQVVAGQNAETATVEALRKTFGDEAFAELAVNVLGCRIYPALRRAMGAEKACPAPTLDF